jgi:biotin transporter BioY
VVKHGFVLGWVFAWFLIGFWRLYFESKVNMWWSIGFFVAGLFLGTVVQTLMDRAEERKKMKEQQQAQVQSQEGVHKY